MTRPRLFMTCTITPRATGSENEYGEATEADGTPVTGVSCMVAQSASTEDDRIQEQATKLFLYAGTTIAQTSKVTVAGLTYEVVSEPVTLYGRLGLASHIEATLELAS